MRHYPYFYPELLLMILAACLTSLSLLLGTPVHYAMAAAGLAFFGFYLKGNAERAVDFSSALRKISGVEGWDSEFGSLGALSIRYKGGRFRFESSLRPGQNHIGVDYCISCPSGNRSPFEISRGPGGMLMAAGNIEEAARIRGEVLALDRKYPVSRISHGGGMMRLCLGLDFEKPAAPDGNVSDMAPFLADCLEFGHAAVSVLSRRRMIQPRPAIAPSKKPPGKAPSRRKKARKRG